MTVEGRLARGKENHESGNKRLKNNSETLEYIASLSKKPKEEKDAKPDKRNS